MKTNEDLQQEVEDALNWEPLLDAAAIGVSVRDGIVTLSGTVNHYRKKMQAEEVVSKIKDVAAVVEEIKVIAPDAQTITDYDIALQAALALKDNWNVPASQLHLKVENGYIYLSGSVPFHYQKEAAKRTVESVDGVKDIVNLIKVDTESNSAIDRQQVIDALLRHYSIDANNIQVEISGNTVILKGYVSSAAQKEEASKVAWMCAGVVKVDNQLHVNVDEN